MSEQLMGYGGAHVSDNDESLKSKQGGVFGLNPLANLILFNYNANVAKEGEPVREAIEIILKAGDREYKDWVSPITKVYGANNTELTDASSEEYVKEYNKLLNQQKGLVTHYLKSVGVTEDAIKNAVANATSFATWAQALCGLLPADYSTRPVDLFLEYQWEIKEGNDTTFLTLPRNMKGGYFVVPHASGTFTEVRDENGLKYVNEANQEHPFTRSKNYMESNKANRQGVGATPNGASAQTPMLPGNGQAKQSTWK